MSSSLPHYEFEPRPDCPGCGSTQLSTLYSAPFSSQAIASFIEPYYGVDARRLAAAPYQLEKCHACGLIFQKYVGSTALLTDLYTDWVDNPTDPEAEIDTYRQEISAIPLSRDAHELMAAAAHLGKPLQAMSVLDYGMGWALWARIARALGCDSAGTEISSSRRDYAARHGVRIVEEDDLETMRFDFINTEQVFEHVIHPLALLKRLAAALAPGGILKISVPDARHAEAVIASLNAGSYSGDYETIVPIQPLEHVNSFTRASVLKMAEAGGLVPSSPSYSSRYAFLRHPRTISLSNPKKSAKEIVRPWVQFNNPSNVYVWLTRG